MLFGPNSNHRLETAVYRPSGDDDIWDSDHADDDADNAVVNIVVDEEGGNEALNEPVSSLNSPNCQWLFQFSMTSWEPEQQLGDPENARKGPLSPNRKGSHPVLSWLIKVMA